MNICENIGAYLDRTRKARGLSITAFSEELNISRSSLQTILKGTGNPRCDTIEHIARHLNVDVPTLLSGQEITALELSEKQKEDLLLLLERFADSREGTHE